MASEQKAQFERFEAVMNNQITSGLKCNRCPLLKQCEAITDESFEHTCEETIWHYIMTGGFLK